MVRRISEGFLLLEDPPISPSLRGVSTGVLWGAILRKKWSFFLELKPKSDFSLMLLLVPQILIWGEFGRMQFDSKLLPLVSVLLFNTVFWLCLLLIYLFYLLKSNGEWIIPKFWPELDWAPKIVFVSVPSSITSSISSSSD